jgi:hypothetical protein
VNKHTDQWGDPDPRWQILDNEGSVHSQHWSKEDALGIAAIHAEDNEALAADLHGEADDAQEIADGLRDIIAKEAPVKFISR